MHVSAIIAAGGRGARFGGSQPKQLLTLGGVPILKRTVDAFLQGYAFDEVIVALPADLAANPPAYLDDVMVVEGGARRQDSVANAFRAVAPSSQVIVIHDAARPLVSPALIERTIQAAFDHGAAIAALQARDTVKRGDASHVIRDTLPRNEIFLAQTPQAFRVGVLGDALALASTASDATDEAMLAEQAGHHVHLVEGDPRNLKITTPEDLEMAERLIASPGGVTALRIGNGYDLHRLVADRPLVLGGVRIPFDKGLLGHSDADALCHAITDAILGAAAAGDIGRHFPDTDAAFKDADSLALLSRAAEIVRRLGYAIVNVDAVVIAEQPKLAPHVDAMRGNLARALGIDPGRVSVKGKTNESVDSMGAGQSIAVHAVALITHQKPIMRLRFAPSPTGDLHVGNARTALFNWLMARGAGATFVLRIEDTDVVRSTKESEGTAIEDLRWMGLNWDEGAEAGGEYGPYRQSERLHIYRAHAVELMSSGKAYRCFCAEEQLEMDRYHALRAGEPPKYVGRCRNISRDEARRRVENGEPAVVRFRVPDEPREIAFTDLVRGRVSFSSEVIGDFVLVRSTGVPAYNFAVVIDDALMAISHVIRGEDHISNTPRQLLLYEAFGWTPPLFGHLPFVLGPDHSKLSKRHGATSVSEFRERGYLPEALANYLALLGWSPGEGEELLPLDELARRFRIEDVGKSAGVFDPEKLAWANRHYMKSAASDRLARLALPFLQQQGWVTDASDTVLEFLAQAVPVAAASVDRLDQVPARLHFLFGYSAVGALEDPAVRAEAVAARAVLAALAEELAASGPLIDRDAFRAAATRVRDRSGAKGKALFHPIRLALTGEPEGVELDLAVPLIDRGAAVVGVPAAAQRAADFLRALDAIGSGA